MRSREAIRRLVSSRAAAPRASTSRGTGVKRKPRTSAARIRRPFAVCQRSSPGASTAGTGVADAQRPRTDRWTTPHTSARPTREGTSASARKPVKDSCSVWPMSMFCGLPMRVAAEPTFEAQARARRKGSGERPRRAQPSRRSGATARQTMSLARRAERTPATTTTAASSAEGPERRRHDPAGHPGVEAAQAELRRDDHEPEEEGESRHVHRRPGRGRRHPLGGDEHERPQEGDAGAVEGEARDLAEQHPEVDDHEDDEDERVQAATPSAAGAGGGPPRASRRPCRRRSAPGG